MSFHVFSCLFISNVASFSAHGCIESTHSLILQAIAVLQRLPTAQKTFPGEKNIKMMAATWFQLCWIALGYIGHMGILELLNLI